MSYDSHALNSQYTDSMRFLKPASRYRYQRVVESFLAVEAEFQYGPFTREAVLHYLSGYSRNSGSYQRFIMQALKGLFECAQVDWPFTRREVPKQTPARRPYFKYEEFERIESLADNSLDRALLRVAAVTGARREELSTMAKDGYNRPYIRVNTAKGGHERVRQLDEVTCSALDEYLLSRTDVSPSLFVSKTGNSISPSGLSARLRRLLDKAGYKERYGWHSIRRGMVTWLFNKGQGMREKEIQELIGWKTPTMPSIYIQLEAGETEQAAQRQHPMFKSKE